MRRLLGIIALLLLVPTAAPAQPPAKYAATVEALERWLTEEVAAKRLPALSLALVDDQTVVWSHGFGHVDRERRHAAGPDTLYRVGSVSKPFTALLLMMFVERGLLDLDAPVQTYLPDFQPTNHSGKALTLRQMLAHRSGLVREPPVGNYFDDSGPSLADTVKSLNKTALLYEPETTTAYSNAALSVVGYVLEKTRQKPFATLAQTKLLDPLGMTDSSFDPSPALRRRVPYAVMRTYEGRTFPAPTWDFGMAPAGSLYSTADDQARLLKFLFAGGVGPRGRLLHRATLEKMWTIQYPKKGEKAGFGLGFFVGEFEGKRRIGHGGAVYGFATELAALPDDKLGVIVCAAHDVANAVTRRVADTALRHLLAARAGKPLPEIERSSPIPLDETRQLAGTYKAGDKSLELYERGGHLWLFPPRSGVKVELRRQGATLVTDDLLSHGSTLTRDGDALVWDKTTYRRVASKQPAPCPAKWDGLIGEYGPNYNTLFILEKDGQLHALIEWVFLYPLAEESANVFAFPDYGLYRGDRLVFARDTAGNATSVEAAHVHFARRPLLRPGETFRTTPRRPIEELRKEALAARPPAEKNALHRAPELFDVATLDKGIKLDLRYATANNFLGTPFYTSARAFLQKPAATALARVHRRLAKDGYGLLVHDAYRPWFVTKMFRDATPERYHAFVADPQHGSRHNRGCAVDLTLYDLATGTPVQMVGGYDEFSDRSYADYLGGTSLQRWRRDRLRRAMEAEGFDVYAAEWWHFDHRDWRRYPIMNVRFEDVPAAK